MANPKPLNENEMIELIIQYESLQLQSYNMLNKQHEICKKLNQDLQILSFDDKFTTEQRFRIIHEAKFKIADHTIKKHKIEMLK